MDVLGFWVTCPWALSWDVPFPALSGTFWGTCHPQLLQNQKQFVSPAPEILWIAFTAAPGLAFPKQDRKILSWAALSCLRCSFEIVDFYSTWINLIL